MITTCFECNKIIHKIESPHYYGGLYATNTRVFCSGKCLFAWLAPYVAAEAKEKEAGL